jgi:hypothetical protein
VNFVRIAVLPALVRHAGARDAILPRLESSLVEGPRKPERLYTAKVHMIGPARTQSRSVFLDEVELIESDENVCVRAAHAARLP